MADWEKNVFGMVAEEDLIQTGFSVKRQNDPVDRLFGDEKTNNLYAKWQTIAAEYQIPMMAQFHGFDTETRKTFRVPVDTHNIEKGLIKVKINQSERLQALAAAGLKTADELYDYVLNDAARLAEQVFTRTKVAKNEVMATGKVTIKENNLNLTVDYGVPAKQTAFRLDLDPDSDLPTQLQRIFDAATAAGQTITGIMTSRANITKMRRNELLSTLIYGNVGTGTVIKNSDFESFMESEYGVAEIITNDLTYGVDAGVGADGRPVIKTARYYPANKVTFFATNPAGKIGEGLWGNPPEANAQKFTDAAASGISPYVYVSQWAEDDPVVTWTRASGLFMPVLYNPNSLFIATVDGDELSDPTIAPEDQGTTIYGTAVSAIQKSDVAITGKKVTGTLKYLNSGTIASDWGAGNFLAIKFTNVDPNATSVLVGLDPSQGSGLVELLGDPNMNGVFKITNKNTQKFVMVTTDNAGHESFVEYDLTGLVCETE